MAVLDSCPGLEVKVISQNRPLKEYADTEANGAPNTVSNYVEVEADGAFEIHLQVANTYTSKYGVRVQIRLDGQDIDGTLIRFGRLKKAEGHTFAGARSKVRGKWFTSNFQFSQFVLDLDSRVHLDQATMEKLQSTGTITALVFRVRTSHLRARVSRRTSLSGSDRPHGISKIGRVPDKVVKDLGLSHHGSVDEPEQSKGVRSGMSRDIDGKEDRHAIAIFHFKYRSLSMLKALRVVPTTPEPVEPIEPVSLPSRASNPLPTSREVEEKNGRPSSANGLGGMQGLSKEELIALITHYRGHNRGLVGQGRLRLQVLLKFHEDNVAKAVAR